MLWWVASGVLVATSRRGRDAAAAGAVSWLAANSIVHVAKPLISRTRPNSHLFGPRALGPPTSTSSFPSSHAAGAFGYATAASLVAPKLGTPLVLLAAGVSWSRVQTARHFPGDVLAGIAVGTATGSTVGALARRRRRAQCPDSDDRGPS